MSILLDALRKSEQQKKLGAAPDIYSEAPASPARRRFPWLMPAVAVIFLALVLVGAYVAWQVYFQPAPAPATAAVSGSATPAGPGQRQDTPVSGSANAGVTGASEPAVEPAPHLDSQPRSPVETLTGERPYQSASQASTPPPTVAGSSGSSAYAPPAGSASSPQAGSSSSAPDVDASGAASAPPAVSAAAAAPQSPPARPGEQQQDSGVISYWQLPESVRQQLPTFKITVLVYHEVPGNRFILMDGKRLQVDDPLGSGNLRLLAIERDRAIFRYGAYRFFVTQR